MYKKIISLEVKGFDKKSLNSISTFTKSEIETVKQKGMTVVQPADLAFFSGKNDSAVGVYIFEAYRDHAIGKQVRVVVCVSDTSDMDNIAYVGIRGSNVTIPVHFILDPNQKTADQYTNGQKKSISVQYGDIVFHDQTVAVQSQKPNKDGKYGYTYVPVEPAGCCCSSKLESALGTANDANIAQTLYNDTALIVLFATPTTRTFRIFMNNEEPYLSSYTRKELRTFAQVKKLHQSTSESVFSPEEIAFLQQHGSSGMQYRLNEKGNSFFQDVDSNGLKVFKNHEYSTDDRILVAKMPFEHNYLMFGAPSSFWSDAFVRRIYVSDCDQKVIIYVNGKPKTMVVQKGDAFEDWKTVFDEKTRLVPFDVDNKNTSFTSNPAIKGKHDDSANMELSYVSLCNIGIVVTENSRVMTCFSYQGWKSSDPVRVLVQTLESSSKQVSVSTK